MQDFREVMTRMAFGVVGPPSPCQKQSSIPEDYVKNYFFILVSIICFR